eukprot:5497050-Pleurochrysis_carterae.AAC.3
MKKRARNRRGWGATTSKHLENSRTKAKHEQGKTRAGWRCSHLCSCCRNGKTRSGSERKRNLSGRDRRGGPGKSEMERWRQGEKDRDEEKRAR